MRIIAGSARGIRLATPEGWEIRPTLDRVREALFSILMPRLDGARFLDLFAGTGANGLEALSRGAAMAVFVDADRRALNLVGENARKTRLGQVQCLSLSLPDGLSRVSGEFNIIFADPPYDFSEYEGLLAAISSQKLLKEGGVVVLEHRRSTGTPETVGALTRRRLAHYGETSLSFYAISVE